MIRRLMLQEKPAMEGPSSSVHRRTKRSRNRRGFSLVEVILALGICAFAVVPLMGLLPVALNSAGEAMEMTRRGKVIQQVSNDLQQVNFSELASSSSGNRTWTFDAEGQMTDDPAQTFYTVTGSLPEEIALPGATGVNPSLVGIVLDIATRSKSHRVPLVLVNRGY